MDGKSGGKSKTASKSNTKSGKLKIKVKGSKNLRVKSKVLKSKRAIKGKSKASPGSSSVKANTSTSSRDSSTTGDTDEASSIKTASLSSVSSNLTVAPSSSTDSSESISSQGRESNSKTGDGGGGNKSQSVSTKSSTKSKSKVKQKIKTKSMLKMKVKKSKVMKGSKSQKTKSTGAGVGTLAPASSSDAPSASKGQTSNSQDISGSSKVGSSVAESSAIDKGPSSKSGGTEVLLSPDANPKDFFAYPASLGGGGGGGVSSVVKPDSLVSGSSKAETTISGPSSGSNVPPLTGTSGTSGKSVSASTGTPVSKVSSVMICPSVTVLSGAETPSSSPSASVPVQAKSTAPTKSVTVPIKFAPSKSTTALNKSATGLIKSVATPTKSAICPTVSATGPTKSSTAQSKSSIGPSKSKVKKFTATPLHQLTKSRTSLTKLAKKRNSRGSLGMATSKASISSSSSIDPLQARSSFLPTTGSRTSVTHKDKDSAFFRCPSEYALPANYRLEDFVPFFLTPTIVVNHNQSELDKLIIIDSTTISMEMLVTSERDQAPLPPELMEELQTQEAQTPVVIEAPPSPAVKAAPKQVGPSQHSAPAAPAGFSPMQQPVIPQSFPSATPNGSTSSGQTKAPSTAVSESEKVDPESFSAGAPISFGSEINRPPDTENPKCQTPTSAGPPSAQEEPKSLAQSPTTPASSNPTGTTYAPVMFGSEINCAPPSASVPLKAPAAENNPKDYFSYPQSLEGGGGSAPASESDSSANGSNVAGSTIGDVTGSGALDSTANKPNKDSGGGGSQSSPNQ